MTTGTQNDVWTIEVPPAAAGGAVDPTEVRRALSLLLSPGCCHELRALPSGRSRLVRADDPGGAAEIAASIEYGVGLYFTLNPVNAARGDRGARNQDVLSRRWLLVDCDPKRVDPDSSATAAEKEHARALALAVDEDLFERRWPAPLLIDSGNGFHLLYRVDLPNDDLAKQLVSRTLKELAGRHNNPFATVDTSVHNASRISKLPGTWARKGPNTTDRPHRVCRLLNAPDSPEVVTSDQLTALINDKAPAVAAPAVVTLSPWEITVPAPGQDGRAAYVRSAFERELGRVALAPVGNRNNALNDAAFRLGTILGAGELDRVSVETQLLLAATRSGLAESEARATIRSGVEAGFAQPRTFPAPILAAQPRANGVPGRAALDPDVPLIVWASTVQPKAVNWLWRNRVPKGFITVFAGRTGLGKSFVACDLIARVSAGRDLPDSKGECVEPGNVLLISEDPFDYVLTPRLIEMGADLSKVAFLSWNAMSLYTLADIKMLDTASTQGRDPVLVVIDPPTNFLGGRDEHKNAEVRSVLMQIVVWLNGRNAACVMITHVNKSGGKGIEALNRVIGSVAWTTTARVAHSFAVDPDNPGRNLFVPMKSNLGELPKGLAYRIKKTETLAKVEWLGEVDTSADDSFNKEREPPRKVNAAEWLTGLFGEKAEWPSEDLFNRGKQEGISRSAIFEAKKLLGLPPARPVCLESGEKVWVWRAPLPAQNGIPPPNGAATPF